MNNNKRLYLSDNKIIGGVCGGFAEYLEIDPTIVRIVWTILAFLNGIGIIAYIAALILIPANPNSNYMQKQDAVIDRVKNSVNHMVDKVSQTNTVSQKNPYQIIGLILLIVGVLVLIRNITPSIPWKIIWPIILIILGAAVLIKEKN